jgi:hypothetical protein
MNRNAKNEILRQLCYSPLDVLEFDATPVKPRTATLGHMPGRSIDDLLRLLIEERAATRKQLGEEFAMLRQCLFNCKR